MKTILKISGIILSLLLVAIISIPYFFKDRIVQLVKEEINNSVNATVDFKSVDLTLFRNFPNFTLSLNELSVIGKDDFDSDTLFAADEFALTLDLGSVFSGNYQVNKILIDQPLINLLVLKNEKANWDIAKESGSTDTVAVAAAAAGESEPFKMTLKSIEMRSATIIYDDKASDMSSLIRNFNIVLSGDMTSNAAHLILESSIDQLTYKMDNIAYLNKAKITFDADILTDLDSSKYIFKENEMVINGLKIMFDGFVAMPESDIYMNLTYNAAKADLKSIMSLIPAFYMEGFEAIKTEGKVAVNGWAKGWYGDYSMPAFNVNLSVVDGKFQYPDLPKSVDNIQINTKIYSPTSDMNDMLIDVSKFHFSIAQNPMDIVLKLKTPLTDPDIDAQFKGKFNLASIPQVYPLEQGMDISGIFTTDLNLKGKQSAIDNGKYADFKASGNMILKDMTYRDADLPEGVEVHLANMNFTPKFIDLSAFKATYNKNTLELNGKIYNYLAYALSDGILKANFNLSADYLNLNNFMTSSDTTMAQNTVAQGEEVPMEAFDVPDNIDFKLQCVIGRIKYDDLDIKTVYGSLTMANKQIHLEQMKMELLDGKMEMNGYYNSANIDSPEVSMVLVLQHFDFKQSYKAIDMVKKLAPIMQYVDGDFTSLMSYQGKLDKNMNPDLKTVNAKGLLSTSQISIVGAKSVEELANTLKIDELKKLSLEPTQVPFAIQDGKLMVKPFETKINGMPFKADGVTYLNQDIDYNLNLKIPRDKIGSSANNAINGLIGQANAAGANISLSDQIVVNAKMTGTTSKPKVSLDFKETKTEIENVIMNEITNVTDELKKQADAEAARIKKEMEQKAQEEIDKQKAELERQKKIAEEKARKKLEEEAKKKLKDWF